MILMGCKRFLKIIIIFYFSLSLIFSTIHGFESDDSDSLDATINDYAMKALQKQHSNKLINVSLPENLSEIEALVFRIRSGSLYERGANISSIYIPSGVIPFPFVKRLAIVYQNLRNLSSKYYKVPNYSLVAPVVGFTAFDASNLNHLGHEMVQFDIMGDPIVITFSEIVTKYENNSELKCVQFGEDGLFQLSNLIEGHACHAETNGYFSIVMPSNIKKKNWVWWVVAFGILLFGLILIGVISANFYKLLRSKKIEEMEGESEKGVTFDVKWIGKSKMPSASMVRTQPSLEHGDIP